MKKEYATSVISKEAMEEAAKLDPLSWAAAVAKHVKAADERNVAAAIKYMEEGMFVPPPPAEQISNLEQALRLAVKYRAQVIKVGDLEVHLSPLAFAKPDEPDAMIEETLAKPAPQPIGAQNGGYPTDEELLLWSTQGPMPDLNAKPPAVEP